MDDLTEWWEDFWETQSQKKELKSNIKADLETKAAFFKAYLQHCYALHSLSEKHRGILSKIENSFDGEANEALGLRFEENSKQLEQLDKMYENVKDSIKTKSGFW
ncbi:hypothetical protein J5S49_05050 [Virgibacillus halodenitrificans]|uniref:hypothetical protein n=1 Tax=Virgibacillus halodenitrificans TaxID=1482 RepID=UPI001F2AF91E|nr:hypothetical protein [Virgibacillus halodenitrificans]MCG1027650.1 hypothetical protein [Virgibacillus halodenitrificans]